MAAGPADPFGGAASSSFASVPATNTQPHPPSQQNPNPYAQPAASSSFNQYSSQPLPAQGASHWPLPTLITYSLTFDNSSAPSGLLSALCFSALCIATRCKDWKAHTTHGQPNSIPSRRPPVARCRGQPLAMYASCTLHCMPLSAFLLFMQST